MEEEEDLENSSIQPRSQHSIAFTPLPSLPRQKGDGDADGDADVDGDAMG